MSGVLDGAHNAIRNAIEAISDPESAGSAGQAEISNFWVQRQHNDLSANEMKMALGGSLLRGPPASDPIYAYTTVKNVLRTTEGEIPKVGVVMGGTMRYMTLEALEETFNSCVPGTLTVKEKQGLYAESFVIEGQTATVKPPEDDDGTTLDVQVGSGVPKTMGYEAAVALIQATWQPTAGQTARPVATPYFEVLIQPKEAKGIQLKDKFVTGGDEMVLLMLQKIGALQGVSNGTLAGDLAMFVTVLAAMPDESLVTPGVQTLLAEGSEQHQAETSETDAVKIQAAVHGGYVVAAFVRAVKVLPMAKIEAVKERIAELAAEHGTVSARAR